MPEFDPATADIAFGAAICADLDAALRREWLVTNGLGGYAALTLAGLPTRRYHGLLVAALAPPVERTVLVSNFEEHAGYNGRQYDLAAMEYADGTIDPHGYRYVQWFALDGLLPIWTFALGDALLEKRVWLAYGANTTYVTYRLLRGSGPLDLTLTPLLACRGFHTLDADLNWQPDITAHGTDITVSLYAGATPTRILASAGTFHVDREWYRDVEYRAEAARGLDHRSHLFAPGAFTATLPPGATLTMMLSAASQIEGDAAHALATVQARQAAVLHQAGVTEADAFTRHLVLAADQFIVQRGADAAQKTVIAGYYWFNDWGRDTMIALPGLTLTTKRYAEAADILRTFARYVADGLLPNNFPDHSGVVPGYNTADATLWYFNAIYAYVQATQDHSLVDELLPVLRDIVDRHVAGTRFGIGVDPQDGLLRAGEAGVQLTWMDAKVGDWVVTPRRGKPVEINALWYNALRILSTLLAARGDPAAATYAAQADRCQTSSLARFVAPDHAGLADVVDGPDGDDWAVRPNQIFAVSLPFPLIDGPKAAEIVALVGRDLLTPVGLRSLAPEDPHYQGVYSGDINSRDGAYHQGTVWAWLSGPYVEAWYRVHGDAQAARDVLRPFIFQLHDAGLGSISEIFDGDAPHLPRGAIAQAWSVAEVLRVWRWLADR